MNTNPSCAPARANRLADELAEIDQAERALIEMISPSTALQGEARERLALLLDFFRAARSRALCAAGLVQ